MIDKMYVGLDEITKLYIGNELMWSSVFSPLYLFKGGQQGIWFDPSDLTTMFQDALGTIPVTKNGDPVGLIKDKSGNGNHGIQTLSSARPTYQTDGILQWLKFDGVDDNLFVGGIYLLSPSKIGLGISIPPMTKPSFILDGKEGVRSYVYFRADKLLQVSSGIDTVVSNNISQLSNNILISILYNNAGSKIRTNNVNSNVVLRDSVIDTLIIGSRGNSVDHCDFKLFSCVINKSTSAESDAAVDSYIASKSGVTL